MAVAKSIFKNNSAVNITKLVKLTMKYLTQGVSMAREVKWEVYNAMRISLAEQKHFNEIWFILDEIWYVVFRSHKMNVICMIIVVMNRIFVFLL